VNKNHEQFVVTQSERGKYTASLINSYFKVTLSNILTVSISEL